MPTKTLRQFFHACITIALLTLALFYQGSGRAAAQQPGGGGLQVSNALIDLKVKPGQEYVHQMVVGSGMEAQPLEITIEARGFGETTEGAFVPLKAEEDTSPYSARSFITKISRTAFNLKPGESVPVEVTLSIPQDLGRDTRYAMVYIYSQPVQVEQGVANVVAFSVPVVITPEDALIDTGGEISAVVVDPVENGKPISIKAQVRNTGNRHYKVTGTTRILSPEGKALVEIPLPLTGTSVIPTYTRELEASYAAMDLQNFLQPGSYIAEVEVKREDGSLVGRKQTNFEIKQAYRPLPEIADANLEVVCFNDEEPGVVDARAKTGVELRFEGTGKVTGCVAVGLYTQPPGGSPLLSDDPGDGGLGKIGVKYVALQAQGFKMGKVRLSMDYRASSLGEILVNSLFLALKMENYWQKLVNLDNQTGAERISGDMPVAVLTTGVICALGGDTQAEQPAIPMNMVWIGAGVAGGLLLIVAVVVFLRRKPQLFKLKTAKPVAGKARGRSL